MSGGRFLTWLADELRGVGLTVVEVNGWQTRARSSGGFASGRPLGVMWHHTASPASWDGRRDADYIATGDPSAPLANLVIDRTGCVWVCAAGATNTNGKGGPLTRWSRGTVPVDSMNTHGFGIEFGNNGVGEPWPQVQIDAGFAASNLVNARCGNLPSDVCTHNVWAPTRKIDPATASAVQGAWRPRSTNSSGTWNLDDLAAECARRATAGLLPPTPPPEEDDDVKLYLVQDSRGAWWSTDTLTCRKYVDAVEVGLDGINAFGWGGSPFDANPGQGPWVLGEVWQPYIDSLPVIGVVPDGAVVTGGVT